MLSVVIIMNISSILSILLSVLKVGYYALGILVAIKTLQSMMNESTVIEKSHDQTNSHDSNQK